VKLSLRRRKGIL